MGRRKFCTGVIVGAVIGGLVSLMNKDTRLYAKSKVKATADQTKYYLKNPSEAVRTVRVSFNEFNQNFSTGAKSTINALEQIEETLDKVTKKKSPEQKLIE